MSDMVSLISHAQTDRTAGIPRFSRPSLDARHTLNQDFLLRRSSLAVNILGRALRFAATRGRRSGAGFAPAIIREK